MSLLWLRCVNMLFLRWVIIGYSLFPPNHNFAEKNIPLKVYLRILKPARMPQNLLLLSNSARNISARIKWDSLKFQNYFSNQSMFWKAHIHTIVRENLFPIREKFFFSRKCGSTTLCGCFVGVCGCFWVFVGVRGVTICHYWLKHAPGTTWQGEEKKILHHQKWPWCSNFFFSLPSGPRGMFEPNSDK